MGLCLRRLRLQYPLQGWQVSTGISGSFQPESVATFDWNRWQVSTGISGNLRAEYAHFSRCVPLGTPHPRVALADASVFSCAWCRLPCAAPVTHQDQGLVTSRSGARRRPLASSMPQKTLGSLSCPIVYSVQITWLPRGSTFARAHGRGVAPLGHAVAGHLYGLRPGLIRTDGYSPTFPPASSLNPTASQTSAKGFSRLKGHEVAHHVIAGP